MDFTLNEEQLAIRDTCREFAEQEIKPLAEEMDRTGEFPYALIRKMGELGLLGLPFPEEYGGGGAPFPPPRTSHQKKSPWDGFVGCPHKAPNPPCKKTIHILFSE